MIKKKKIVCLAGDTRAQQRTHTPPTPPPKKDEQKHTRGLRPSGLRHSLPCLRLCIRRHTHTHTHTHSSVLLGENQEKRTKNARKNGARRTTPAETPPKKHCYQTWLPPPPPVFQSFASPRDNSRHQESHNLVEPDSCPQDMLPPSDFFRRQAPFIPFLSYTKFQNAHIIHPTRAHLRFNQHQEHTTKGTEPTIGVSLPERNQRLETTASTNVKKATHQDKKTHEKRGPRPSDI